MRFLAAGPNIPDELLEARDAGNVVFFCGAGVSQPALPGFLELAEKAIVALGAAEGSASVVLLNRIRDDRLYAPPLDQLFNQLQLDYGPAAVDTIVYNLLSKPRRISTEQQSIVLRLSQNAAHQPQIVTTNFDRRFERAQLSIRYYEQPALPDLASGQPLEGVVYLHGRMPAQKPDGTRRLGFVLSSADFGRAYLADGWATRFVRELVHSYVIVLLGYSANDPPVRYLLEGLHSQTDKTPAEIYAFDSGSADEVQVRWRDRGVTALAYANADGSYSALWESLRAWAARADDPDAWRRTIVSTLAQAHPQTLQPYERGQVVSLIRSQRGARVFADAVPPPPAEWLCVFDRNIRYGNPRQTPGAEGEIEPLPEFSLDDDPPRPASKPWRDGEVDDDLLLSNVRAGALARLGSFGGRQTVPLPDRLLDLSRWLGRVLEDPIAAWWAAGHSQLHDRVLEQIEWHLRRPDQTLSERMRKVWSLLVEAFRYVPEGDRWYHFLHILNRTGWTNSVLREFERITTPYLRCTRPYSLQPLPPDGTWDELNVAEIVAFQVKFPPRNPDEFNLTSEALPAVLRILCRGLQHAAGILADLETRYWQTVTFHAEQKPGEYYLDGKDRYLLRVVKFFDRLAQEQPRLARVEVSIWPTTDEFFFDKLRIYALMNGALFSAQECAEGLMALSDEGFWNSRHQRELLHTLRARWAEFSDEDRGRIERRITDGPCQREGEEPENYTRRRAITSAKILGWLELQCCKLSAETQRAMPELRKADERWRPEWDASADESHESRSGSVAVNTDASKIKDAPLAQIVPRAVEHTRHPFAEFTEYRPFNGLVKERPFRALAALSYEARNAHYPPRFWQSALSDWPNEIPGRLRCLFAARLVRLPQNVVFDLRSYIPRWFRTNFVKLAQDSRERFWPVWDAIIDHFFAIGPEGNESGTGDGSVSGRPVNRSRRTTNHSINSPMGIFAETLFDILESLKRKKGQRIPADIRSRLERLFDAPGYGADYAVCETTRRLRWLFYIDPNWTTHVIIPFLDFDNVRSEPAWNGYLYDNRVPDDPKLFGLLKPHFLRAFPHSSSWAWDDGPIRRLNEFLVVACYWNVKDKRYISYAEARSALQQATEEGREHAIWFLAHIVRDLNEWGQFGKPFIEQAWPRERKYQTSTSSRNFAHLAEQAGDNFPNVVRTIVPLLGPVEHGDMLVHSMTDGQNEEASLAVRFPEAALSLLDRVVPQQRTHGYYELRSVLDLMVSAAPTLRQDERWRRLAALA